MMNAFISKVPIGEEKFYYRYIDLGNCGTGEKGIDVLQNGRYVYSF